MGEDLSTAPRLRRLDLAVDRDAVLRLSVEYMAWVDEGISAELKPAGSSSQEPTASYVARTLDEICGHAPPQGVFYLAEHRGELAGMGGLRQIAPGVAELKRLYVRPAHRGHGLGHRLLQRLLADARAFGCHEARLDTAPFMHAAHRLYAAAGFIDGPPHAGAEVPQDLHAVWRFMARRL